jgi:hypothetical protein
MAHYGFSHLDSINASIRALYCKLGNPQIMFFNRDLNNPDFQLAFSNDQIIQVQQFARRIAEHYRLSIGTVVVSFKNIPDKAAQVELSASSDFLVEVNPQAARYSDDLLAILAHEITHIYLFRIGLSFDDRMQNEILTDTAATYLGLGTLILNAYSEQKKKIDQKTTEFSTKWFGYLTPVEFGYILAKRAQKFKCDPVPQLKRDACDAFYAGLAVVEAEYRLPPLKGATPFAWLRYLWNRRRASNKSRHNEAFVVDHEELGYAFEIHDEVHVIFKCRSCLQRLRIPAFRRLISVRCPKCGSVYECTL